MCGIAGIAAWRGNAPTGEELAAMCDVITHRGPDDAGYLVEGPVALGMRRLSIIDLATGHQPIYNEDGSVAVVFNGEIYNYRELRAELERAGHRFATATDTEVIVHLWEEDGRKFAKRLNGMFAIALFDRRQGKLVLARDHVGIKPLYVAVRPGELVFGSEIKAVLASGRVPRRLDLDALGQFLAWEYVPGPATLFADIRKLEPGCCLVLDLQSGQCSISEFWRAEDRAGPALDAPRAVEAWADEADAVIGAAVRRQMVSDVPLGAFLSGGVDSSLVVAHMGRAHTFSIGFDDPTYDETEWSKRVANHLGVDHKVEIIRPDVRELFGQLMEFMDDPIGDFSIFPTYLVSKLARREVKVALSGDGGDELFGGYETFVANERARFWERIPRILRTGVIERAAAALPPSPAKKGFVNKLKRFVEGASLDARLGHARWRVFATEQVRARLFTPAAHGALTTPVDAHILALAERARGLDERDRALYVDFKSYLVDNCLVKVDRMSMACSLEARVPLLDLEVIDFASKLPSALKFRGGATKLLLKEVAARHIPRACIDRPKQGFSIPIKNWLKNEFAGLLAHHLDSGRLRRAGIFDAATVQRLRREHDSNHANHSHLLWGLLVFEQWRDRWGAA